MEGSRALGQLPLPARQHLMEDRPAHGTTAGPLPPPPSQPQGDQSRAQSAPEPAEPQGDQSKAQSAAENIEVG